VTPALADRIAHGSGADLRGAGSEGTPYRVSCTGLMLTATGPSVLEYNCRLGDPEAQVVLPCIDGDFLRLAIAACDEDLDAEPVPRVTGAAVGVVLASQGYPDVPRTGVPIMGLEAARAHGARVYLAGVRQTPMAWS
jgi:phosphoribosylamine--glycine ligase